MFACWLTSGYFNNNQNNSQQKNDPKRTFFGHLERSQRTSISFGRPEHRRTGLSQKVLFLAALFPIEIRTLSPIISLKHVDFLVLIGNAVLGSVWFEREREKIADCP